MTGDDPAPIHEKEKTVTHSIRHIVQVAVSSLFLMFAGTTAAFAGPPPIEPVPPASGGGVGGVSDSGFPWMLTGAVALLAIAVVALSVVLWSRYHASHHRLATP
ncbi:MAG TPA: hypothetical protein VF423_04450 [Actinomycetes bacterium]